jgi:hypothetical protein
MRRSFLFLAAGLLASLAFVSPSQAGSTIETEGHFSLAGTGVISANDLEFTYSPGVLPPLGAIIVNSTTFTSLTASSSGNTLTFFFTPTASGSIDFTFTSAADPTSVFLYGTQVTGVVGKVSGISQEGHIVAVIGAVPEPTSMALLGIGMASFFTYRRLFKRHSAV